MYTIITPQGVARLYDDAWAEYFRHMQEHNAVYTQHKYEGEPADRVVNVSDTPRSSRPSTPQFGMVRHYHYYFISVVFVSLP